MFVVKLDGLDLSGGGNLEVDVVATHVGKCVRQQNSEIDFVTILDKSIVDIFYHGCVGFNTGGWSTSVDENKVHSIRFFEHGQAAVFLFLEF